MIKILCRPSVYTNLIFIIPVFLFLMIDEIIIASSIFISSFLNLLIVIGYKKKIIIDLNYVMFHICLMIVSSILFGRLQPIQAFMVFVGVLIGVLVQEQSKKDYEAYQSLTQIVFFIVSLFIFFLLL